MVSERDLFALQRLSLKGVGAAIRAAGDVAALAAAAQHDSPVRPQPACPGRRRASDHRADQPPQRRPHRASRAARWPRATASICTTPAGWRSVPRGAASRRSPPTKTTGSSSRATTRRATAPPGCVSRMTSTRRSTPAATRCAAATSWRRTRSAASPHASGARFASWVDHGASAGSLPRQHLLRLSRDRRTRRRWLEPLREAGVRPSRTSAAVPAADGGERVAAAAAAQLARRHRDANGRRSRDHRHQAAGHGAVRRRRSHLCAGARLCRDRHRTSSARDRATARRAGARGRRLGRRVRVPADAAPAGADRTCI